MDFKKVLVTPSLVTFNARGVALQTFIDTRITEIRRLKLTEISLFLTVARPKDRAYIREQLLKTPVRSLPHVHIRNDMTEAEVAYYMEHYNCRRFTTHYAFMKNFRRWSRAIRQCIGIENNLDMKDLNGLEYFGGLVIDLSHYHQYRVHNLKHAALTEKALANFPVLANHASAILKNNWSKHFALNISQYDYIKNIPKRCFSPVISLEIGNSFPMQCEIVAYVKKIMQKI